jgi:DNA modification methylase
MTTDYGLIHGDALHIPLRDETVDVVITSPPYFALRSYQDDGEHYAGQIGSEPTPADFLAALWSVTDELWRVLKPTGSLWVNLGDKYAGSGGHNNSAISSKSTLKGNGHVGGGPKIKTTPRASVGGGGPGGRTSAMADRKHAAARNAARRNAPDRYNQTADVRAKSLMGLPWRFAMGLICPDLYRAPFEPAACWHDDGPGPCRTCPPRRFPQWIGRAEVIWSKPNGLPESVTDRVRRSHENWFHLVKRPRYYAAVDEVRESYEAPDATRTMGRRSVVQHGAPMIGDAVETMNPLGKLPGSVWTVPSEPLKVPDNIGVDHFAAFPQELVRRIILGWSPSGICTACGEGRVPVVEKRLDVDDRGVVGSRGSRFTNTHDAYQHNRMGQEAVYGSTEATITGYACACDVILAPTTPAVILDPFVGTGTTPMVARALGRYGVGLDLSRDYLRLATWRIGQSRHGAKSIHRTNRERQGKLW